MRKLLIMLLIILANNSFAQTGVSWYKMLNGKIDKYPITIHLHKAGHTLTGYYYYTSTQEPIYFSGEDSTKPGTINLIAFADYNGEMESFQFSLNKNIAKGTWKKTDHSKPLLFSATENTYDSVTAFNYIYTFGSVKLRPKLKESPEANFDESAVWPIIKNEEDVYLKNLIASFFNTNANEEIGATLLKNKKQFLAEYITEYKSATDKEIEEAAMSYSFDESSKLQIVYQSPRIITFARNFYTYTGGAHGMYGTGFTSVDLIEKKKIELNDVLNDAGIKLLPKLLEKYFRKAYNLTEKETLTDGGLFENIIEPSENFYITGKGIGFCYNPYEIGPYAMGEIMLFIPFSELNGGLQLSFMSLL